VATVLTNTVKQVRDLTSGTPLFTAVDGLRTLTAGTTLTNTVVGLRDMTAAGGSIVTAVKQAQTDATALYALTKQAFANDTALDVRLDAAENLNGVATVLTNTVKQVRDLTSGTALYTAVNNMRTLVAGTALTNAVNAHETRLDAAENLNGIATVLTNTVKQVRDLTTGTALYTAVNNMRTLVAGTALTDAVNDHELRLTAAEGLSGVATTLTNTVKQVRDLTTGTALYTAVNNMRTLVAGTTLTNTVIALRYGTGTSPLVTSVKALQTGAACCGTTAPGSTNWVPYGASGASNLVDVSIASCGFTNPPTVVTSLTGTNNHYLTMGQTSLYYLSATSFRVYVTALTPSGTDFLASPMTPAQFNGVSWAVAWCAFA
jgi:hypothetical protein